MFCFICVWNLVFALRKNRGLVFSCTGSSERHLALRGRRNSELEETEWFGILWIALPTHIIRLKNSVERDAWCLRYVWGEVECIQGFVRKQEGKRLLEISGRRLEKKILKYFSWRKKCEFWSGMVWLRIGSGERTVVRLLSNLPVPQQNAGNFFTSWQNVRFSKRFLLQWS